ncbi:MAG: DUF3488 domain-containing protein, partial [Deltaproteobacteria bacterium]|nr:DUF3488 domain-containing protein [Deltaproteobacteria bacterium]
MSFSTYFILISYLMVATGFMAAALTGAMNPFILSGLVAFAGLGLILHLRGRSFTIPKLLWNGLALIILTLFLTDYLFITGSLIEAASRFLTILMVIKLFDLKTNKDYLILYILTFFQLLAASVSTTNLSFLLILILYILIGMWTMVVFNLKRDWEEKSRDKPMPGGVLTPAFFLSTSGLAFFSLLITFTLFFIIPRIGIGLLPEETSKTIKVAGFSEKVDLGELGPVKLDPTVVMRARLPQLNAPPSTPLYFRGMAFDYYDGKGWRQTIKERSPLDRDPQGVFRIQKSEIRNQKSEILRQDILLEPIETDVLFATSSVVAVSGPPGVNVDSMGSIYLPSPYRSRITYTVYSINTPQGGIDVDTDYLQIPEGMERVVELARNVTKGIDTPLEKARAIEGMLKGGYRYTLNPGKGEGKNLLEDFFFYTKEGYCEQFATAMAILLRGVGIPTRFITGFLQGEWNRFGGYLLIRQRDAHSWVEVYLGGAGWVTFDPTPSVESVGIIPPRSTIISLYLDSLRWRWNRYIIHYTLKDQIRLTRTLEGKIHSLLSDIRLALYRAKGYTSPGRKETGLLIITAVALVGLSILAIRKGIFKKKHEGWTKTPDFYLKMLKALARKGLKKAKGKTP